MNETAAATDTDTDTPRRDLPPDDPMARAAQTFPRLTPEMVARIATYGREDRFADGALLFQAGDRSVDFFVVLSGAIEIFESDAEGEESPITIHREHQFTGEVDSFNDRKVLVTGRARGDTRVLRLARADFRRLMVTEQDLAEIFMRAFILRRVGLIRHATGGLTLIGAGHDGDTLRLERFLERNGYPYRLLDTEADPTADGFVDCLHLTERDLPVIVAADGSVLRNPPLADLADVLGLTERIDPSHVHDVAVIGAGPSGLAAAVYAASEGLSTLVIESTAPGGQAGTSSKIENYLGFPTGISGQALAGRAQVQAQKFGARLAIARAATRLHCDDPPFTITLEGDHEVRARAIVIATGATYRSLDVPDYARFEGHGVHYAATGTEARVCSEVEVAVVGGGNSAGQAAVYLSSVASHVYVIVRGPGLAATMSDYLVQRIAASRKITLLAHTEITALGGDKALESMTWRNRQTGETDTRPIANLFVMIGAVPNTRFLSGCVDLDDNGFVCTGRPDANGAVLSPFATSRPGVFAVGDVRAGSVKRVASAVGEGAVVVQAIHRYLHPPG